MPQTFTLDPGSAIGPDLTVTVTGTYPLWCEFSFDIPAPGYCSDPCDYDMAATVTGDEDICLSNCPDHPGSLIIETSGGTAPFKMDFRLEGNGSQTWDFPSVPINAFQEIQICIDNIPAPIYNASTGFLTLPASLAGTGINFSLLAVYDKFECVGILDVAEHFISIHKLPAISTDSLALCLPLAKNIDLHRI